MWASFSHAVDHVGDRSPSMTDSTSDRFEILSITLQLIHGATDGPPGLSGSVFPTGDLTGLADYHARDRSPVVFSIARARNVDELADTQIAPRMSAIRPEADSLAHLSECLFIAKR